jgi:pSer/pThr/pTyr-binding forkhead associated (FHA) protein
MGDMIQQFGKLILALPGGQEQEFSLAKSSVFVGRAATSDIVVRDARVSRTHARLEYIAIGCALVDLGSANGTYVNGVRVERANLASGDTIIVGNSTLRFEIAAPRTEPDLTQIHSEADLEATLSQATLPMTLVNTHLARLAVHTPTKTWEVPLIQDTLTVGRHPENDLVIDHPRVSRRHARIERHNEIFVIRDLQSTNGTWLGQQRIEEHTLQNGDAIRIGNTSLVFKSGFESEDLTLVEGSIVGEQWARRPVIIVPGFMGSELWRGQERLWPNVRQLFTRPEVFRLPEDPSLDPRDIVREVVIVPNLLKQEQYSRLSDYLVEDLGYEPGRDLLEFPYDWRQDIRRSAERLAAAIDHWPVTRPITLIAHSMGCLLSRYYVERLGGKNVVGRLIFLGGPHHGVPKAITSLIMGPNLLPFGLLGERLREVLATFPSMYQVLPIYGCVVDQEGHPIDLLDEETWLPEARRPYVRNAREFRRELGMRSSVPAVSIFGYGLKTVTRTLVERTSDGRWLKMDFDHEPTGDSTVPEASAVVEGSEIHPVQQYHGSLYVDNDVKMRLKVELTRHLQITDR